MLPHPFHHMRTQWEVSVCGPGNGPSPGTKSAGTLLLDFQPPELWAINVLEPPSLWYFCYSSQNRLRHHAGILRSCEGVWHNSYEWGNQSFCCSFPSWNLLWEEEARPEGLFLCRARSWEKRHARGCPEQSVKLGSWEERSCSFKKQKWRRILGVGWG